MQSRINEDGFIQSVVMSCFFTALLFLVSICEVINGEVVLTLAKNRSGQFKKKEDYSFESKLKRATEECSYIARTDDESHREELMQRIKNEINARKVEEFYKNAEDEKRKSKEYYDRVEREQRKKALEGSPPRRRGGLPQGYHPPPPRHNLPPRSRLYHHSPPPPFVFQMDEVLPHGIFKRSSRSKDPSFSQGTFKDHNNCFSRCVFAGMELVDILGFPQESYLRKALEDHVDNRKLRASKLRRVNKCFDDVKKVAIDDNCIYATKIFKCMKLDEPGTWS